MIRNMVERAKALFTSAVVTVKNFFHAIIGY